jgi:hypothetical protein
MHYHQITNILQIMYSCAAVGTEKRSRSSILNDTSVERVNLNCSGVQYCEYLAPNLKDMHHYAVDTEMLNSFREARLANSADSRERDANRYEYIVNTFQIS